MTIHRLRSAALLLTVGALSLLMAVPLCGETPRESAVPKLTGPYTHDNLSVFLVCGPDRIKGKTFLTLDEALAQKKVVVHETRNVNQLTVDNVSNDAEVFIQSGDIVKGGQQDRVLAYDLVVPPGAKEMPLAAFCVEAGRWTGRHGEVAGSFGSSKESIASNGLKVAARAQVSQQEVWSNVTKTQVMLGGNLKANVADARSVTSLQLTLENKKLNEAIDAAVKALSAAPEREPDVIGCAVAINGKVIGADVYASSALFKKLWPKLLKAAAVEALAERKEGAKFDAPTAATVRAFLADAEKGKVKETTVSKRIEQVQKEGEQSLLFESRDYENNRAALRCSYLTKTAPAPAAPAQRSSQPQENVKK
jgi:hypothetical protein